MRLEPFGLPLRSSGARIAPFARDRPPAAGSSSSSRRNAGARNGRCGVSRVPQSAERRRLRCSAERPRRSPPPRALPVSHACAKARASRARPPSARPDPQTTAFPGTNRRRSARARLDCVREREGVDELELVVEVVLEPEHDLNAAADDSSSCRSRRSSDETSACSFPQPHSARNRARVRAVRAAGRPAPALRGGRPATGARRRRARLPQRLRRALAVGDVEQGQARRL